MKKIAFLGLGVMGYPMAGHLQSAGMNVCVYNRTQAKAEQWVSEYGGSMANTPAEAVNGCDYVFCCVGADDDVRQMAMGTNGAFDAMKTGAIFIDQTTTSDSLAKELYEVALSKGLQFMDAPVSGGQAGAQNGALTIMCGGDDDVYAKISDIMKPYTKYCGLIGGAGSGQQCKMINQIAFTHVIQGLSEGIVLAQELCLDTDKVCSAISGGSAGSWQMDNRWKTMTEDKFDFGFAVDLGLKDLNLVLDCAENINLDMPTTRQLRDFYTELQDDGHGRDDTSALIRRYKKKSKAIEEVCCGSCGS